MDGFDPDSPDPIVKDTTAAGISCDYAAGYFTYFAKVDQWADAYTYFKKIDGIQGVEPQAVYTRSEADTPDEDEIKEAKGEED